jgi:hypothetical protein
MNITFVKRAGLGCFAFLALVIVPISAKPMQPVAQVTAG